MNSWTHHKHVNVRGPVEACRSNSDEHKDLKARSEEFTVEFLVLYPLGIDFSMVTKFLGLTIGKICFINSRRQIFLFCFRISTVIDVYKPFITMLVNVTTVEGLPMLLP